MCMNFIKIMNVSMCKEPIKWGIGEGRLPLTSDPENPNKFFAEYEDKTTEDEISKTPKSSSKSTSRI